MYDFQTRAIRFLAPNSSTLGGRYTFAESIGVLPLTSDSRLFEWTPPAAARAMANYPLFSASAAMKRAEPPLNKFGLFKMSVTDTWRGEYSIGSSRSVGDFPLPEVISLDRQLRVGSVPVDAAVAEALAKGARYMQTLDGLTARVFFDVDRVELTDRVIQRQTHKSGVIFAKVDRMEIFDPDGRLNASIPASSLPAPSPASTDASPVATPPGAGTSAPPRATTPGGGGPASDAAIERQREEARRNQERMEALQKASAARGAQAQKEMRCVVRAMKKTGGDENSKAYKTEFEACMKEQ